MLVSTFARTTAAAARGRVAHILARSAGTLGYEPNKKHMPKFKPQDNSTGIYDKALHQKESWSYKEIDEAIGDNSVFSWGASNALRKATSCATRTEGVYIYDQNGHKILDWSAGAVCSNLGHTVPETIKEAVTKQFEENPFVYGDLYVTEIRARLCKLLERVVTTRTKLSPLPGADAGRPAALGAEQSGLESLADAWRTRLVPSREDRLPFCSLVLGVPFDRALFAVDEA